MRHGRDEGEIEARRAREGEWGAGGSERERESERATNTWAELYGRALFINSLNEHSLRAASEPTGV